MSEDCPHCVFEKTEANCRGCFEGSHYKPKPLTNADRIRAMTDEQLAYFLLAVKIDYAGCAFPDHESCPVKGSCYDCWLEWMKEEAKGDNDAEKRDAIHHKAL